MKVITKEYNVFSFNELSDTAKQRVIDDHYQSEYESGYNYFEQDILKEFYNMNACFEDINLLYSLSHCQGDGLSFSGELNLRKFLDNVYSKKLKDSYKWAICEYIYTIISKGSTGHYCYASKNHIDYEVNYQDYKAHNQINKLFNDILEEIQDYYIDICTKLERYGYNIIDYRMDFNEMQNHCEINEYMFLENGEMFNI